MHGTRSADIQRIALRGVLLNQIRAPLLGLLDLLHDRVLDLSHDIADGLHDVADFELSGYEADFFYLDLTSTATALKFEDGRRGYVIFWQTCDSMTTSADDPVRSDVFNAMTHTLVSNLTGQEDDWGDEEDELMFERKLSARQERELEDREYRRSRYEKARQDFEDRLWRRSDDSDDMRLEDFMVADRGARGSKRGKKPRLDEEFEGEFNFGANPHDSDE